MSAGLLIENHRAHGKAIVAAALVFDLGMLAVFKYAGFFVENSTRCSAFRFPCRTS